MVAVVDFVVVVVGVMVVVQVVVVFDVGMPVSHIVVVRHGVGMGTGEELGVDVVGPLREERPCTPLCMLVTGKIR